jgi:hypothetical protein
MPWGKYAGLLLEDVPLSYLCWILDEATNVRDSLRAAIETEVAERLGIHARAGVDPGARPISELGFGDIDAVWVLRMCEAGYRTLARTHHPDVGGSLVEMQGLNAAIAAVRRLFGQPGDRR